jgi:hypothetical protein
MSGTVTFRYVQIATSDMVNLFEERKTIHLTIRSIKVADLPSLMHGNAKAVRLFEFLVRLSHDHSHAL